ncbi:NAD(P)/FAD-dependent oxidoreductase [Labilibacter marinus]|uniref:NAD(P)/FAD-dependent oxidoreductase n=1 Tax=Labilibacter marinus TaxID=1477105 RepID=UPI0008334F92|nr:FAD-dependent oxidoreductase [Labilibacter marinus]
MKKDIALRLTPEEASSEKYYKDIVAKKMKVHPDKITCIRVRKRSIDARQRQVMVQLYLDVYANVAAPAQTFATFEYQDVSTKPEVLVVGAGPGGLFAALRLIELGYKPIVLERGKDVNERKKDLALLNRNNPVNPDSNYAFGEGGAGTFSDGKLYTRSTKRGDFKKMLNVLHFHGAQDDILVDSHPHIGTDRLPQVIKSIRESIIAAGGEVLFNSTVTDIVIENQEAQGVVLKDGTTIKAKAIILATGHSARDVYAMLKNRAVELEAKTWAMGVRVEHPQELIDQIQYNSPDGRGEYLPAASYNFSCQVQERGVYSFCMCPGGFIVPAMTGENEMVVNGMSPSKRNSPFANSGMVVEIRPEDIPDEFKQHGVLAGLEYQKEVERLCYINGGKNLIAPAQRLTDFVEGKLSFDLPETSYVPGTIASPLHFILPDQIAGRLQEGFKQFGKWANGFIDSEAIILGTESRTSSPVRVPRDPMTLEHVQIKGLFPCGEGAGYAGGIASSAIDGEKCADAVDRMFGN